MLIAAIRLAQVGGLLLPASGVHLNTLALVDDHWNLAAISAGRRWNVVEEGGGQFRVALVRCDEERVVLRRQGAPGALVLDGAARIVSTFDLLRVLPPDHTSSSPP